MDNGLDKWEAFFSDEDKRKSQPRAVQILVVAPTAVETNEEFSIHLTALRGDGYPAHDHYGEIVFKSIGNHVSGLPDKVELSPEDRGIKSIHNLKIEADGFSWIKTSYIKKDAPEMGIAGLSNPIRASKTVDYRIYWGDLHIHSSCGDCHRNITKTPNYGYWFGRYVMGLDFVAVTDHATQIVKKQGEWEKIIKAAKEHNAPGEFVTFLGFETDYQPPDGGHFNIYFLGDQAPLRTFNESKSVDEIFDYTRKNNGIAISHHSGRGIRGRDYSNSYWGEEAETVVEVYSKWGSSETPDGWRHVKDGTSDPCHYYREALKRGFMLGVIGGTDDHNTCPASYMPMPAYDKPFYSQPGIGAIIAPKKERNSMWEAIKSRRTYCTSNNRVYADFRIDGSMMGSEIQSKKPKIKLLMAGRQNFRFVEIYKNDDIFFRTSGKTIIDIELEDKELNSESYYFVRAETEDNERAWLSPIWVKL